MQHYIDFVVRCPLNTSNSETIRVYYVWHENRWFPLPPNICDNGNDSSSCQHCVAGVIDQALQQNPPFSE